MVHLSPAKPKPLPLPLLILLIFYYDPDSQLGPTYSCGPQEHSVTCKIHSGVTLGCVHASLSSAPSAGDQATSQNLQAAQSWPSRLLSSGHS